MNSLTEQANAFGLMILSGVAAGLLFDFYRVLRGRVIPAGVFATLVGDIIYSFVAVGIFFGFLVFGSWGEFRIYLIAGAVLGLFFYFLVFSRTTLRFLISVFYSIRRGKRRLGMSIKNGFYQSVNLGVQAGRKVGMDKIVARGRVKVGALQERIEQWKPKIKRRTQARPKQKPVEPRRKQAKLPVAKRFNKTARFISSRSRNLLRGFGKGLRVKR